MGGVTPPGYRARAPQHGVLHSLIHRHLETFLADARARGDGGGLPRFVARELREFLTCGQLARGFARFRCDGCRQDFGVVGIFVGPVKGFDRTAHPTQALYDEVARMILETLDAENLL